MKKIIAENFVYIDKTKYIFDLTKGGWYYFLSRPRRFGKSMLTTTIQALFEGKKLIATGINFSKEKKEVADILWEVI